MRIPCLLCGRDLPAFHVFPRRTLFTKPLSAPQPEAIADMGIAWCDACRHISSRLASPIPVEELHARTYRELYRNFAPTGLSGLQLRYTDFVGEWLASWLSPGSRVLDIGCHDGYLLKRLADHGHACEGIEPSPYADYAREHYGLAVVQGFFTPDSYPPASFDAVIVRHVTEHVADPVAFLRDAVRIVKPGGLLYVEVPNSQWSLEETYFPEFHADHISYFTMASLLTLLERIGAGGVLHAEAFRAYVRFPFLAVLTRRSAAAAGRSRPDAEWLMTFGIDAAITRFTETFGAYVARLRTLRDGSRLAVWGAGSIGIQYAIDAGWEAADVTYVDVNPVNQGMVLPVTGHRIQPPTVLRDAADRLLIASGWEDDVRRQAAPFLRPGTPVHTFADLVGGPQ